MVIKTESVIIQKKSEKEKKVKRPNILFLMSDEHRFDVAGFSGNTIVKTPHLDSLAKSGVVFNNAYTPSPVCIPARQCMLSGQYPKTCGCEVFGEDLAPGYMTFARRFSEYAYATVACGKLHHCGTDQMQGWTQRIGMGDIHVSDRFIDNKDEKSFEDYSVPVSSVKWTQVKEVKRAGVGKGSIRETDDYTVEGAVRFIDKYFNDLWYDREQKKRPLLLKVSLVKPHYPYLADEDKFRYYLNRVKPYFENVTFDHPALTPHKAEVGKDVSELTQTERQKIGVVFDEGCLPQALNLCETQKVMANVFAGWDKNKFAYLTNKANLPQDKAIKDFSRGMKMKAGIAAALAHDAKLLILDEATSGLDPVAREEVLEILTDFTRDENHSILISSHIVSDLEKLCDYIAFLHKGKLLLFEEKGRCLRLELQSLLRENCLRRENYAEIHRLSACCFCCYRGACRFDDWSGSGLL